MKIGLTMAQLILQRLKPYFKRRDTLAQDPEKPIIINCRGGVGRTATVAIIDNCKKEIDAMLQQGMPLDDITINIPEIIYFHARTKGRVYAVIRSNLPRSIKRLEATMSSLNTKDSIHVPFFLLCAYIYSQILHCN